MQYIKIYRHNSPVPVNIINFDDKKSLKNLLSSNFSEDVKRMTESI